MSNKKQRVYEASLRQKFKEDCERYGIPTTRCQDVWVPAFFAREGRRAYAAAKAKLAEALAARQQAKARGELPCST